MVESSRNWKEATSSYWRMSCLHSVPLSLSWNSIFFFSELLLDFLFQTSLLCMYCTYTLLLGQWVSVLTFSLPASYINVTGQSLMITTYPQSSQIKSMTNGFNGPSDLDETKTQSYPCNL